MTNREGSINKHFDKRNTWKILVGNVNSFPSDTDGANRYKLEKLRTITVDNGADVIILSEHNKNIDKVPYWMKPSTLVKRWWKNTILRASYLASGSNARFEPGGTMIITHTKSSAHTCNAEEDSQQLGRWNSITLRGKNEKFTTIISIYRPNKNQETYSRQTAYTAKRRKTVTNEQTPEQLWFTDLGIFINEKREQGHDIIVAGDFNDDLNDTDSKTHQFMARMELREVMNEKYGPGPATYIRGTKKIDGIFASKGIIVESGKYIPFDKSPSDHRWIEVNIFESSIIGISRDDPYPSLLRRTTSKIPSIKEEFQRILEQQVLKYKLSERIDTLYKLTQKGKWKKTMIQEYEIIEERMQRAVRKADRDCKKVRRGQIPFSPTQKRLMGAVTIIKQLRLRYVLKGKPNRPRMKRIRRLAKKYSYSGNIAFHTLEDIDKSLKQAEKDYGEFKRRALDCRWEYIHRIASELNERDGKGRQHHFKVLQHRELTREYFKRIKKCEGKLGKGGVDRIQVNGTNGEEKIEFDKNKIENEIMRVNELKLLQAHNTPLRQSELSILLGEQGDFKVWENILRKKIQLPADSDDDLKLWYSYITNYDKHTIEDFTWTNEEYIDSWKKMSEEKSTIPGIQVAHIKCLDPSSKAANTISKLALIPLMTGYSPITWRKGVDSMIPKKVADLRPEKLRLILLLDARFNHNNKLIGKKMMEYGERNSLLAPEQYGSRKEKSSNDHALNKRLSMDIVRQSKTDAVYIANDAKSCYDRIILMVAYLTMRNFGIPKEAATSTIATIMNMKHHVRTRYGDSTVYYGGDKWDTKPHGCGQGNGYGPALWACISSPLLHILRLQGYGTKIQCPLSNYEFHMAAFAFVDDVDMIQTSEEQNTNELTRIDDLFSQTQGCVNLWTNLLRATGGDIEISKTFFVPIIHKWHGCRTFFERDIDRQLVIYGHDYTPVLLTKKDPNDSFFTLGIWQSPSGNETAQIDYLTQKITEWDKNTKRNKLTWGLARIAMRATIGRTLLYSLSATALDYTQCNQMQKSYRQAMLGKIGFVRTVSTILAEAPTALGGIGLLSFEVQQFLSHVNVLLLHGPDHSTTTNKLLRSTIEYYALETGLSGDPLLLPAVSYVTKNTWIMNTLQFMQKYNVKIHSDIEGLIQWGAADSFIMERIKPMVLPAVLPIVNKVRLYLRVVTLFDLISADGTAYDIDIIHGNRGTLNPNPSYSRYKWPRVPEPTEKEKNIWFHSICMAYNIIPSLSLTPGIQCSWFSRTKIWCKWLYSRSTEHVYEKADHGHWVLWEPISFPTEYPTRSRANNFQRTERVTDFTPQDCIVVSMKRRNEFMACITEAMIEDSMCNESTNTAIPPDDSSDIITQSFFCYNISLHSGIIISDGSYGGGKATYAFVAQPPRFTVPFKDIDFSKLLFATGTVQGSTADINSYRGEIMGILAAIRYTNKTCSQYGINSGTCTLYCDNQGALYAAFGHKRPTPRWSSFDIIRQIREEISKSPITWKWKHVLGHQDKDCDFIQLDFKSQGNVIADYLASKHLRDNLNYDIYEPKLKWIPYISGHMICGNVEKRLLTALYKDRMIDYWTKVFGLPTEMQLQCDWDLYFRSIRTQSHKDRPLILKYNTRILPVGKNLKRRLHSDNDICPCCGNFEDHEHIIQCEHPDMTKVFNDRLSVIQTYLLRDCDDIVRLGIMEVLLGCRHTSYLEGLDQEHNELVTRQLSIGTRGFLAGLWLQKWHVLQQDFFSEHHPQKSAELWMVKLIHLIQTLPIYMWRMRNHILHKLTGDNVIVLQQHRDLDEVIEDIFVRKPHSRLMAHCDNAFFGRHSKDKVKIFKLHRKTNWVTSANLILTKYEHLGNTEQSRRFKSFFQWDRG